MRIEVNQKILFDILAKSSNSDGRGGIGRGGDIKFNVHVNNGGKYIYFYTAEYDEDGDEFYDTLNELVFIALDEPQHTNL